MGLNEKYQPVSRKTLKEKYINNIYIQLEYTLSK